MDQGISCFLEVLNSIPRLSSAEKSYPSSVEYMPKYQKLTDRRYSWNIENRIRAIYPHGLNKRLKILTMLQVRETPEEDKNTTVKTSIIAKMIMLAWIESHITMPHLKVLISIIRCCNFCFIRRPSKPCLQFEF